MQTNCATLPKASYGTIDIISLPDSPRPLPEDVRVNIFQENLEN